MRVTVTLGLVVNAALAISAAADAADAAARAKTGEFDATYEIRCAQEVGQALGSCKAEVARSGAADAAVVVTFPNGFARILTFEDGKFLRGNATMSGVGTDTDWRRSDGIYHVRVDDQRFEFPEALVFGD